MSDHYGIDLGTRNTAVECKSGRLASAAGGTIPSAVAYDLHSPAIKFGDDAITLLRSTDTAVRDRWSIATSFKTALESDAVFAQTPRGGKTAAQVLEDYLRGLVQYAEEKRFPRLKSAVFSIPVGFSALSRARLVEAALAAGIEPLGVVSESTAAYLQIVHSLGTAERVAVVDWGAGTLDVSVLRISGGGAAGSRIDEQACFGSAVAGDRIDTSTYEVLAARARASDRQIGALELIPVELVRSVLSACERAKIALGDPANPRGSTDIVLPAFTDRKFAQFTLTSDELRTLAAPARTEAFKVLDDSIEAAELTTSQLDRVIFVGGCTGILGFREEAQERYRQAATFPNNPEWIVAGGALQVASGHASYESLQKFGCVLDDGYFLPLTDASTFDGSNCVRTVAATESTQTASLIFAVEQSKRVSVEGTLSVPLQGHLGEPVHIRTTLNRDLTVLVEAWSHCCHEATDVRRLTIANTRFRFRTNA